MTIGYRQADQAAMLGTLFPAEKAHQIGLIDHLSEPDQLMADTQTEMAKWLKISGKCFFKTTLMSICRLLFI